MCLSSRYKARGYNILFKTLQLPARDLPVFSWVVLNSNIPSISVDHNVILGEWILCNIRSRARLYNLVPIAQPSSLGPGAGYQTLDHSP